MVKKDEENDDEDNNDDGGNGFEHDVKRHPFWASHKRHPLGTSVFRPAIWWSCYPSKVQI